jgi:hypothetical protein
MMVEAREDALVRFLAAIEQRMSGYIADREVFHENSVEKLDGFTIRG